MQLLVVKIFFISTRKKLQLSEGRFCCSYNSQFWKVKGNVCFDIETIINITTGCPKNVYVIRQNALENIMTIYRKQKTVVFSLKLPSDFTKIWLCNLLHQGLAVKKLFSPLILMYILNFCVTEIHNIPFQFGKLTNVSIML